MILPNTNMNKKTLSKVMSDLAKIGHKKKPRSKAFYQRMQKKAVLKRSKNKSSTKPDNGVIPNETA